MVLAGGYRCACGGQDFLLAVEIPILADRICFDSVYFNSALEGFKLEVTVVHAAGKTSF